MILRVAEGKTRAHLQQPGGEPIELGHFATTRLRGVALDTGHALLLLPPGPKGLGALKLHDPKGALQATHPIVGSVTHLQELSGGRFAFGTRQGAVFLYRASEPETAPKRLTTFHHGVIALEERAGELHVRGDDREPTRLDKEQAPPPDHLVVEGAFGDRYAVPNKPVIREANYR